MIVSLKPYVAIAIHAQDTKESKIGHALREGGMAGILSLPHQSQVRVTILLIRN